jgi:cysteine-rich repeat protein
MSRLTTTNTRRCLFLASFLGAFTALVVYAPTASAYEQYSQNKDATNCRGCHGDFRASPYVSLADGVSWGDDAHDIHRRDMLGSDCDTCHGNGPFFPVLMGSSAGGTGFPAIGCVGCHGRDADTGNDGISPGYGAGLRQHHTNAGVTDCADCHSDAVLTNYTPVGEDVLPDYYFMPTPPDLDHPDKPTDSCSPNGEEDYAGSLLGLDNDGNGLYDGNDPACAAPACGDGMVDPGEECDDGNTQNGDCCDENCQFEPVDSPCPDGLYCNGDETCDGGGTCQAGTPIDCDDLVDCTVDACNEATDSCDNTPDDGLCDNGVFCDGIELCDPVSDCQPGTPVDCDDGVSCTDDSCDEVNDVCANDPNDLNCPDDGLFCTGIEFCDAVISCSFTGDPCGVGTICNEAAGTCDRVPGCGDGFVDPGEDCDDGNILEGDCCSALCQFEPVDSPCPDGLYCNGDETCDGAGTCKDGTPIDCDDLVGCTVDACNEATDSCDNTPDDGVCGNGVFCDGMEVCDPVNDCQPGTATDCSDGVECTDDSCDEVNAVCVNDPNDLNCPDDGLFCTGDASCDAVTDCSATGDPCADGTVCNEETATCDSEGGGGGCQLQPPGSGRSGMSNATPPILILLCLCALLIRKRRRNRRPATGG